MEHINLYKEMCICMISCVNRDNPYGSTTRPYYIIKKLSGIWMRGITYMHEASGKTGKGYKVFAKKVL